jgi:hypothetical protein
LNLVLNLIYWVVQLKNPSIEKVLIEKQPKNLVWRGLDSGLNSRTTKIRIQNSGHFFGRWIVGWAEKSVFARIAYGICQNVPYRQQLLFYDFLKFWDLLFPLCVESLRKWPFLGIFWPLTIKIDQKLVKLKVFFTCRLRTHQNVQEKYTFSQSFDNGLP